MGSSGIIDPYSQRIPYELHQVEPDIVLVSHEHRDHNAYYRFENNPMLVKRSHGFASETELNLERTGENLKFHGMPSYHDDQEGRRRGPNTIWHWFWEGVHFAH